jgi:hypothetical protein
MVKKVKIEDFVDLGLAIKTSLNTHLIDPELHYSLISDILFNCAYMIDEKTGSYHHENIDGLVDANIDKFVDDYVEDLFVSSIKINLGVGKKHIAQIYKSHIENSSLLVDLIERLLNIQQTGKSFEEITERRKGIQSIGFSDQEHPKDSDWNEVAFSQNGTGSSPYSVLDLSRFITEKLK